MIRVPISHILDCNLLTFPREGQPYFWTGGRVNHGARSVTWPSGATTSQHRWSRGQPNNSEGGLAILLSN